MSVPALSEEFKDSLRTTAHKGFVGALAVLYCFLGGVIGSAIGVPVALIGMFSTDDFPWFPVYFGIIVVCGLIGLLTVLGSSATTLDDSKSDARTRRRAPDKPIEQPVSPTQQQSRARSAVDFEPTWGWDDEWDEELAGWDHETDRD